MSNYSSSYTTIFNVDELKNTPLSRQIKDFKLDGNTPKEVVWLALERISKIEQPKTATKIKKNDFGDFLDKKELTKQDIVNYLKDYIGNEQIAKFVDENYNEKDFNKINWQQLNITEEQIKRLQGINPNII